MKRQSIFFALFGLAMAAAPTVAAATYYGIRIGGVNVTSDNNWNVTGGGIATVTDGKITYDPSANVLTLRGAYVDCQRNNGTGSSRRPPTVCASY